MAKPKVKSTPMEARIIRVCRALAHPGRLKIVMALLEDGGTLSVTELAEASELSQSNTSIHLNKLASAGIIERERGVNRDEDSGRYSHTWQRVNAERLLQDLITPLGQAAADAVGGIESVAGRPASAIRPPGSGS